MEVYPGSGAIYEAISLPQRNGLFLYLASELPVLQLANCMEVLTMANEKRLIDANALREAVTTDYYEHYTRYHDTDQIALIDMVCDDIEEAPTVDAVEVVHGRLGVSYNDEYYGEFANCLECGTDNILPCNYCRNCGAKMDLMK